jgi:prepilin-type processing-associated H-X9-DG protein
MSRASGASVAGLTSINCCCPGTICTRALTGASGFRLRDASAHQVWGKVLLCGSPASLLMQQNVWHNYRGKTLFNMLFADGHLENYLFPPEYVNWLSAPPPDPAYRWW